MTQRCGDTLKQRTNVFDPISPASVSDKQKIDLVISSVIKVSPNKISILQIKLDGLAWRPSRDSPQKDQN